MFLVFLLRSRYIDQFSRCLYVEYKKSGIDVQCQVRYLALSLFTDHLKVVRSLTTFVSGMIMFMSWPKIP